MKAQAQDSCLKGCGSKYLTDYSCRDVVDLLLCFPKLILFLLAMFLVLCTSPDVQSGNASCQSNQRSYFSVHVLGRGSFSQPRSDHFQSNPMHLNLGGGFSQQYLAEGLGFRGLNDLGTFLSSVSDSHFPNSSLSSDRPLCPRCKLSNKSRNPFAIQSFCMAAV